jgi:hypothetical protein
VHRRAVDAEEDAVGDGRPGRVLGVAIEAHLHARTTVRTGNCTEENKNHTCARADTDGTHTERDSARSISSPQSNQPPPEKYPTLLSDLARSLRNTAFLSAKGSVAAMAPTQSSNQPARSNRSIEREEPLRIGSCAPCSIDGWADRSARERGREVARWGGDGRREGVEARRKRKKWWGWTVLPLPSPPPPLRASVASSLLDGKQAEKDMHAWT